MWLVSTRVRRSIVPILVKYVEWNLLLLSQHWNGYIVQTLAVVRWEKLCVRQWWSCTMYDDVVMFGILQVQYNYWRPAGSGTQSPNLL